MLGETLSTISDPLIPDFMEASMEELELLDFLRSLGSDRSES